MQMKEQISKDALKSGNISSFKNCTQLI